MVESREKTVFVRKFSTDATRSACSHSYSQIAIDFGPSGLSGIGSFTARNLDGRGVHVIITGDKGKGNAELFNSLDINYESCWNKKWAPGLVQTR